MHTHMHQFSKLSRRCIVHIHAAAKCLSSYAACEAPESLFPFAETENPPFPAIFTAGKKVVRVYTP